VIGSLPHFASGGAARVAGPTGGWEKETDELMARGRERLGTACGFSSAFPERMADLYRSADLFTLGSLKE
jgi:hypothetical protein